jgi:dCTP diphosphatase
MPHRKQTDKNTTLQELKDAMVAFREERDWGKHHTPRSLVMSIAIEAAELMEHFQWSDYSNQDRQEMANELGDILSYCLSFADVMGIDITTAFLDKLEQTKKKYPVELFNPASDNKTDYNRIKKEYRKGRK